MKELKQVVGIDVAQKELVVTIGRLLEDLSVDFLTRFLRIMTKDF
jgi:hypothetical protein